MAFGLGLERSCSLASSLPLGKRNMRSKDYVLLQPANLLSASNLNVTDLSADKESELNQLRLRRKRRGYLRGAALIADAVALITAFLCASVLRFGALHDQALTLLGVILPTYVIIAAGQRCYSIASVVNSRFGGPRALGSFIITLSLVGLVAFFLKVGSEFSRLTLGVGSIISVILIPSGRYALSAFARRALGGAPLNLVVITDGTTIALPAHAVLIDAAQHQLEPRLDDPKLLDRLGRCVETADRVVVACSPDRRAIWAAVLKGADVRAEVLAPELDALGSLGVNQFRGQSTLVVAAAPLGVVDRTIKRIFDLSMALGALLVLSPVMLAIAVAIRLDSPGPVLFAQERVGLGNRLFRMYKFRSMFVDRLDAEGRQSAGRTDDRVTRVGRFIRSTSLDELPQLFNVLTGAMSIVGPRPHALGSRAENRLFWDIDPSYWHRHAVKPGLTGLAQVRGYRGATEKMQDLTNRLKADLEYLADWTIWRDVKIIATTFKVLIHRNAY